VEDPERRRPAGDPVTFARDKADVHAYARDEKTLSRPWAIPGTPGLEHKDRRLEKEHISGNISYNPRTTTS